MKIPEATWWSSLIAGVLFGAATQILKGSGFESTLILFFMLLQVVPVAGMRLLRQASFIPKAKAVFSDSKDNLSPAENFRQVLLPAWGRMLIWLVATVTTMVVWKWKAVG